MANHRNQEQSVAAGLPEARKGLLSRDRILRLDQGHPVLVIEGPSGYGKSVLAEMWLERHSRTATGAWLTVNDSANDPVRFLEKLLRVVGADFVETSDSGVDDESGRADRFDCLKSRLQEEDRNFCLVIDDAHLLRNAPSQAYLEQLVQLASPSLRICLTMQPSDIKFGLGKLASRGRVLWIDARVLALQKCEVGSFARLQGQTLAPADLEWLYSATEGWPALTQLALAVPLDHKTMQNGELIGSGPLRSYIYERFVRGLSADEQDVLWTLSCLGSAPVPMLTALEPAPAKVELALLKFKSLGIVQQRDPDDRTLVTLHQLVREAVSNLLAEERAKSLLPLIREASQWYWQHGQGAEAVGLALQLGTSLAPLARSWMIELGFSFIFRSGQHQTFLELAEKWEKISGQTDPCIDETAAWALIFQKQFSRAERRLQRILECQQKRRASTVELQQGVIHALSDQHAEAGRLAQQWITRNAQRADYQKGVACTVFAFSRKFTADFDEAHIALRDAMACFDSAESAYGIGWAHVVSGFVLIHSGRYRAALAQAEAGLQRCPPLHGYRSLRAMLRAIEAYVRYERNEISMVREGLDEVLPILAEQGIVDGFVLGCTAAARARVGLSDIGGGLDLLTEGEEAGVRRRLPRMTQLLRLERALLLLRSGLTCQAQVLVNELTPGSENKVCIGIINARLALATNDTKSAIAWLKPVIERVRLEHRQSRLCEALIQLALAEQKAGRIDAAFTAYSEALDIGQAEGYFRMFLDEGESLAALTSQLLAHGSIPSRSAKFLARKLSESKDCPIPPGGVSLEDGLKLNKRERQIISLLSEGLSNAQIAQRCFISQGTVKWYMHNLFEKFCVPSRTALLSAARDKLLV